MDTIKYINGLNFRISGQIIGCAEDIFNKLFVQSPVGILIVGSPEVVKLHFLRIYAGLCQSVGGYQ